MNHKSDLILGQKLDLIFVKKIIFYEINQKLDLILEPKVEFNICAKNYILAQILNPTFGSNFCF